MQKASNGVRPAKAAISDRPAHLLAVLAELGATPAAAVMIGDSANDVRAARGAEVPCVLVSFGHTATPARALGADAVVDALTELPALLDRFS